MKSIHLNIGGKKCHMEINGLMPLDERLIEKYLREMFLNILYDELDYNARIFKLEIALKDAVLELQTQHPWSERDYNKKENIIKNSLDVLNDKSNLRRRL